MDKHFSNTMEYRYHISQIRWNKDTNTFYAEAPHLECLMPDGNIHPESFPNQKGQFFIDNTKELIQNIFLVKSNKKCKKKSYNKYAFSNYK